MAPPPPADCVPATPPPPPPPLLPLLLRRCGADEREEATSCERPPVVRARPADVAHPATSPLSPLQFATRAEVTMEGRSSLWNSQVAPLLLLSWPATIAPAAPLLLPVEGRVGIANDGRSEKDNIEGVDDNFAASAPVPLDVLFASSGANSDIDITTSSRRPSRKPTALLPAAQASRAASSRVRNRSAISAVNACRFTPLLSPAIRCCWTLRSRRAAAAAALSDGPPALPPPEVGVVSLPSLMSASASMRCVAVSTTNTRGGLAAAAAAADGSADDNTCTAGKGARAATPCAVGNEGATHVAAAPPPSSTSSSKATRRARSGCGTSVVAPFLGEVG